MFSEHNVADDGAFFYATNPTIGTGIQLNANVTAFSDTNALFVLKNTDDPNNALAKRIFPRYLRLYLGGTAPTATVSMEFAFKVDNIDRFPTTAANMTTLTPANVNGGSTFGPVAKVASYANAGAMTVPASSTFARTAGRARIPTGLGVVGDAYVIQFGAQDWGGSASTTGATRTTASAPGLFIAHSSPIVLAPGQSVVCHMWWLTAATTAATFEFDLGWYER